MSGHSKWSTIKRKKGALDAKRGKIFTKLIREIATAARLGGGDINGNPRLRLVVEKARAVNMPKDNIERAIKKGAGGDDGASYDPVTYEGYGPGGVAVLVEGLTDNRNRTAGEVRHAFTKNGGNLGQSGSVSHLFTRTGLIEFERAGLDADALLEAGLEAGADDVVDGESTIEVVTDPKRFEAVRDALVAKGFQPTNAQIAMRASTTVQLSGAQAETMLELAEALEDLDDVQEVFSNFDISEAELESLSQSS
jgi:YebC/PmpR family DNA-binding regulatory protein